MLVLVVIIILFFWLVVGAVQFLLCITTPRLRRFALSSALWWACWGPCNVALLMLAGLIFLAVSMAKSDGVESLAHAPLLLKSVGWTYLLAGVVGTIAVATSVAWVHQFVIRRLPFGIFKAYASAVTAGIGSIFGWCLSWWILAEDIPHAWIPSLAAMLLFTSGFGWLGYRASPGMQGRQKESPQEADLN